MNKIWSDISWDEYLYWQQQDKKTLKKINALIKDIERNGNLEGIGIAYCFFLFYVLWCIFVVYF